MMITPAEKFVFGPTFRWTIGGGMALLAVLMLVGFVAFGWVEVDPAALQSNEEEVPDSIPAVAVLVGDEMPDEIVKLSGWAILSGSNDTVPTLNLDRAAQGDDGVRFVDYFLIGFPLLALALLVLAVLYILERLKPRTALTAFVVVAAFIFLWLFLWNIFSTTDWRGYDQIAGMRRQPDRQAAIDIMTSFYSMGEQQLLGILALVFSLGSWLAFAMADNGMLRGKYYGSTWESMTGYMQKRTVQWYATAVILLAGAVYILQWFYPQAADNPTSFYQFTYQGIADGALLALIALGLVLIYKASDVINFAHGELMMMGAYVFSALLVKYDFALGLGLIVAALIMILVGALIERLFLRPLIGEPIISVIMVTIGLSNVLDAVVGIYSKNQPQDWQETGTKLEDGFLPLVKNVLPASSGLRKELTNGVYQVFEEGRRTPVGTFQYEKVYVIGIVLVLIFLLIMLFKYSKQGVAMRATADDQQAALSMGISVKRIFAITWGVAALFAGAAGVLIGDVGTGANISIPGQGLRAFPVIILGGLDSVVGAIIGGLVIGVLEQYAVGYIDPMIADNVAAIVPAASTKEVIPYVVLIGILMFRPYGLFGKEIIERV